ncbi:hypothetical protein [Phytoactinopolyspora halotolerans]|uniref:WD40 repeat domain-containing protein n=1 Tax=Phytoactinopolyspora halotolerans TaxID=1981512 RepID=A0A6L9SDV6_9ACTN|nr:hypothetical protein [Phytoactinopolyspora halotolerans]NEE03323.1 hypothetical protein [Phytoactinopolyspora halotolerans]
MNGDVEEILTRELRDVASGLEVPVRPLMPQDGRQIQRPWRPLLVAAAMILIVAGAVAAVSSYRGDGVPQPATSPPIETPDEEPEEPPARPLTADVPTVPFLFDGRSHVDGEQLPGSWGVVNTAGGTWTAQRADGSWWWGVDTEQNAIAGTAILQPRLSPDGALLAVGTVTQEGGQALLIDTRSGETVNTLQSDVTGPGDPDALGVVAVTNDAKVFLESNNRRLMWLAAEGDETVGFDETAPDQWVQGSSPAGLIVFDGARDGERDATYLAEVSESGTLNRLRTLPGEGVVVNPSGTWLGYGGVWGGQSRTIPEITAQRVDGSRELTLRPPDDRELLAVTWEDDDLLLAELYTDGNPTGLARCSVREESCLVIDVP